MVIYINNMLRVIDYLSATQVSGSEFLMKTYSQTFYKATLNLRGREQTTHLLPIRILTECFSKWIKHETKIVFFSSDFGVGENTGLCDRN